jgi:hypothetical protein
VRCDVKAGFEFVVELSPENALVRARTLDPNKARWRSRTRRLAHYTPRAILLAHLIWTVVPPEVAEPVMHLLCWFTPC